MYWGDGGVLVAAGNPLDRGCVGTDEQPGGRLTYDSFDAIGVLPAWLQQQAEGVSPVFSRCCGAHNCVGAVTMLTTDVGRSVLLIKRRKTV
jgi:hypothetical protein